MGISAQAPHIGMQDGKSAWTPDQTNKTPLSNSQMVSMNRDQKWINNLP